MAARHLVADRDLSLLSNIYAHEFVYARIEFVLVLSCEDLDVNDDTCATVWNAEGCVADFSCLLTEDCAEQSLFRCEFGFALWRDLADEDVACNDFTTDFDDTVFIKVFENFIAEVWNISCDLLFTELCITAFHLMLFNVD